MSTCLWLASEPLLFCLFGIIVRLFVSKINTEEKHRERTIMVNQCSGLAGISSLLLSSPPPLVSLTSHPIAPPQYLRRRHAPCWPAVTYPCRGPHQAEFINSKTGHIWPKGAFCPLFHLCPWHIITIDVCWRCSVALFFCLFALLLRVNALQ